MFLLLAPGALAGPLDQGSKELTGGVAFESTSYSYEDFDLGTQSTLTLTPGFGYFVADNMELRGDLIFTRISASNGSTESFTIYGADASFIWHFGAGDGFVPFVGGGLGMRAASDSEDGDYDTTFVLPVIVGGGRVFLTDSAALNIWVFYNHQMNALFVEDINGNQFGLNVGFSVFLQ